ncbi:helix-turn-helix domain-containing protein [Methylobacterium brachythecii]|uniref:Transposase-like protein n=1 Tax=Methylobacterium brachythecii TaxID=1176177 RepID=A0A7W6F925_9HYPH|nr:helix-turn-helix domain-containing protein [Methylobacterium brachythecii]MBB3905073.1 transposase-like protein [Methylobacterium brachythecii]GLS44419.1 hypothetical protein GCM10007884_24070 [Methylobacterium brachythecii]
MPARRISDSDRERMAELREQGVMLKDIAAEIGCSESSVWWHCLRIGAEAPKPRSLQVEYTGPMVMTRNGYPVRRFTADEDARLLALEAQGLREIDIARAIGRRRNAVVARLMTLARREARMEASA